MSKNKIYIKPEILNATKKKNSSFSYSRFANTKESVSGPIKDHEYVDNTYSIQNEIDRIKQKTAAVKAKFSQQNEFVTNETQKPKYKPIEFISPINGRTKKPKVVQDVELFEEEVKKKINKNNNNLSKKILINNLSNSSDNAEVTNVIKPNVEEVVVDNIKNSKEADFKKDNFYEFDEIETIASPLQNSEFNFEDEYEVDEYKRNENDYFFDDSFKIYESFIDKIQETSISQNDYLSRKTKLIDSIRDTSNPFNYFRDRIGFVLSNNTVVYKPEIMPVLLQKQPELVKVDEDVKHYTGSIESEFLTARKNHRENQKIRQVFSETTTTVENNTSQPQLISRAAKANVSAAESKTKQMRMSASISTRNDVSFTLPPLSLLKPINRSEQSNSGLKEKIEQLETFFKNFKINARVENSTIGPTVARFELSIAAGTKVSKISNLKDDIKLALASKDVRIEAPIPGKNLIGIEIPAMNSRTINIRELIESKEFKKGDKLEAALGLSIENHPTFLDISSMPHGLISGSTGSGKSVSINALLISLLYKNTPRDLRMILVDPKVVELSPYNGIPHLLSPVISDPKEALNSLKWAAQEMDRRYNLFATTNTRNLDAYNKISEEKLPKIVIVIDELADLMMVASNDVEIYITRIAQKSRAAGIHMILATQRPSVEVITGLIKANIPTRIAFAVSSSVDSRTILDQVGAESLLGKGDMLFSERGKSPVRLQAPFITDDEINNVISHWQNYRSEESIDFNESVDNGKGNGSKGSKLDSELDDIAEFVISSQRASTSLIQRKFSYGYNKAARLIDQLEEIGVIGPQNGTKPREVYMSFEQYLERKDEYEGN